MMKPMLPTLTFHPPFQGEWQYEIKYDGFRGILEWNNDRSYLWSRNGKDLLPLFPEIQAFLQKYKQAAEKYLPLILDGELVSLENPYKANFHAMQTRGRLRSQAKILQAADAWPCKLLVFDLLNYMGKNISAHPYKKRKLELIELFHELDLPLKPAPGQALPLQAIPYFHSLQEAEKVMKEYDSEGLVAKLSLSEWEEGKRTHTWLKLKNWKTVSCFITAMDEKNGYFHVGVWKENQIYPLGLFLFGLDAETKAALRSTIQENFISKEDGLFKVSPGICVELVYLEWYEQQLREPHFKQLRFDLSVEKCTYEQFMINEASFPAGVEITHPEKLLWADNHVTKLDYLRYLRKVSAHMLPFLTDRVLTLIRAPHGMFGESFYQKSIPETAPDFVDSFQYESNEMIVCNHLQTLIWLGNQLAIEFHIPFQTIHNRYVSEIVFDLDPPSRSEFHLAIKAAELLKQIFDQLKLTAFIKLSGNKGMQVYIPIQDGHYTWEDSRLFTEFVANFLITYEPDSFTIERLKKNRGNRLYVDFIQHAEGKTIIAPYSVRNNEEALVAAPIYWHEINDGLRPEQFTIWTVQKRLEEIGDPFASFFHVKNSQPFDQVLQMIKGDG